MSDDPKSIAADIAREYREDATRWTQGAMARFADGTHTWSVTDPRCVCWCIRGAIDKRTYEPKPVFDAFNAALGFGPEKDQLFFVDWNDRPGRTIGEVIELCEKVARG